MKKKNGVNSYTHENICRTKIAYKNFTFASVVNLHNPLVKACQLLTKHKYNAFTGGQETSPLTLNSTALFVMLFQCNIS